METPRISVVILSYNFEKYIAECIESILAQTLPPFEILISDDRSIDNSWSIICEYQRSHPELIKSHLQERNVGPGKNSNSGTRRAQGNLITVIDGDDRWLPTKLEREWSALAENPNARIAYSNVYTIDDEGRRTGIWYDGTGVAPPSGDVFLQVFAGRTFQIPFAVFRHELTYRSVWEELDFADEDVGIFLDLDFKIRATARFPVIYTGEALIEYRHHEYGIHNRPLESVLKDLLLVFFKNFPLLSARSDSEVNQVRQNAIDTIFSLVAPLQRVCDERLQLIESLDAKCKQILQICDERLRVIEGLEQTAQERLELIQRLDARCKEYERMIQAARLG